MARKGAFTGVPDYSSSILKQIAQAYSTSVTTPAKTTGTAASTTPSGQYLKNVASGKITYDQALKNYVKSSQLYNQMPETGSAPLSKAVNAKVEDISKKLSRLQRGANFEANFFALGGSQYTKGTNGYGDTGAGWTDKKVQEYWNSVGKPEVGQNIVNQRRGYDQYGNDLPGWKGNPLAVNSTMLAAPATKKPTAKLKKKP